MNVTVVGAGVIGLCTALELERRGHAVTVVAERVFEETLSAVAGAVWFPYQVGADDLERVARLAQHTRQVLAELARCEPRSGVDVLRFFEIDPAAALGELPSWDQGEVVISPAPVPGSPPAWVFAAPRAQPSLFLPYLARGLRRPIEQRRIASLSELPGDAVINCTGMGARTLTGDEALIGVFGQVLVSAPGQVALDVTLTDARDPDSFFYVIPRRHELVLGGIARPVAGVETPPPEPEISARILAHAARLGFAVGPVRSVHTGLRPVRPRLRIERDPLEPRLFHNYGHGGSGFTLCFGAACEVAELVEHAS